MCVALYMCMLCPLHIVVAVNFLSVDLGYIQHLWSQIVWMWTFLWSIDVQFLWNKHWKVSYWLRKGICLLRVITRHGYHLHFTFQKECLFIPQYQIDPVSQPGCGVGARALTELSCLGCSPCGRNRVTAILFSLLNMCQSLWAAQSVIVSAVIQLKLLLITNNILWIRW